MADVTVIIPTHNRKALLARTLHSVLSQRDVVFAVVVVDDGGADGTSDAVEALQDERVSLIRHATPRGVSAARNSGIAASVTPWLAFVDDDDLWAPTKLRPQLDALLGVPSASWSCTAAVSIDSACRLVAAQPGVPDPTRVASDLLTRNVIAGGGSGVVASRELVQSVGGFDEAISNLADWDFYVRLGLAGSLAPVPQPLLGYYVHPQGMAHDVERSAREYAYLDVKYERERRDREVALDVAVWLPYLARLAYNSGRRMTGTRLLWQLAVRHRRAPVIKVLAHGLAPSRLRRGHAERRRVTLPAGWEPMLTSWLPQYATGWLDEDTISRGGAYDRIAAQRGCRIG